MNAISRAIQFFNEYELHEIHEQMSGEKKQIETIYRPRRQQRC